MNLSRLANDAALFAKGYFSKLGAALPTASASLSRFGRATGARFLLVRYTARTAVFVYSLKFSERANKHLALAISSAIALCILVYQPIGKDAAASDFHYTAAGILGGALALVLSLSIIPAQKAAEAFSTAILKLYSRDFSLLMVFLVLTFGTFSSLYMGLKHYIYGAGVIAFASQFLILGASFDALRYFYRRTLDLLVPQTAVALVQEECSKQIRRIADAAKYAVRINELSSPTGTDHASVAAAIFGRSNISATLGGWISQLQEFAHKSIARRDALATNSIVSAMSKIGIEYADARKRSIILLPDLKSPLFLGRSDVNDVLAKIYESVRIICEDAVRQNNELVVQHCVRSVAQICAHTMQITHSSSGMKMTAPLANDAMYYLKACVEIAIRGGMSDAQLEAVHALNSIISKTTPEVESSALFEVAMDCFILVARKAYLDPNSVLAHPAIEGIMKIALRDIALHGYEAASALNKALAYMEAMLPAEVVMDSNGQRLMQAYPPYDMGNEVNLANVLQQVANRIEAVDAERTWVSPYHEFCEASAELSSHFRKIGAVPFGSALVRKRAADTLLQCVTVHARILKNPPTGGEVFFLEIEEKLTWMLNAVAFLFPASPGFSARHASDVSDTLAYYGMHFLKDENFKLAHECALVISYLAKNPAESSKDAFKFADIVTNLEALALAADVLGQPETAVLFRKLMSRPKSVADDDTIEYLNAIVNRIAHFRERVERDRYPTMKATPEQMLYSILDGAELPEEGDYKSLVAGWSG